MPKIIKKNIIKRMYGFYFSLIIICVSSVLCIQIITDSFSNQKNNNDYAELNHIKYGLFSVDAWKKQITVILNSEINKLYLSRMDSRQLREHIEVLMNTLIDKIAVKIKEGNTGSAEGWFKQAFINIFVSIGDIKKGVPEYADAVIQEMTKSKTKDQIKILLNKQLGQYIKKTFDTQDASPINRILLRTGTTNAESAKIKIDKSISVIHSRISFKALFLIVLSVILFSLTGFSRQILTPSRYILLVLCLLMLLISGVTTPMINMEAKISQLSFMLMGYPVHFENQVLYFQSKSILDVFWIMITHKDIQMKLIGVLMLTFSIFFPLLKILSTMGYYFNYHNARKNPVINFFIHKSGKWSMADVMVIAIFMAYIGFNGIITSQLGQLSSLGQELVVVTTNGTSLQPGYYLFLTYTLLALFLSEFLIRKSQAIESIPARRKK